MRFEHIITKVTGPAGFLVGVSDLLVRASGPTSLLYSVSAKGGGVLVMDLNNGMQVLEQAAFPSRAVALDAPRYLAEITINGTSALISYAHYGTTIDVFPLNAQGLIGTPYTLNWQANNSLVSAETAAEVMTIAGRSFFALASRHADGLTVWEADAQNRLRPIEQTATAGLLPANDVLAMAQVTLGGQKHLLALSSGGSDLLNYQMGAEGQLTLLSRLDARDGLAISKGRALEVVEVAGQSYALVGAAGSNSLAVVALDATGRMVVTDHVMDERDTRFAGLKEMATLTQNGQVYIATAGSDDGITLMTLLPNGRLVHLATLVDDNEMALANVSGLALFGQNGRIDLVASGNSSGSSSGISHLYSLTDPVGMMLVAGSGGETLTGGTGRDQLIGGAGNDRINAEAGDDILVDGAGVDTLTGGAGADVFIFQPDGAIDYIFDFEPGIDRIDLSAWGRIYSMDAIRFIERSRGAEIRYGDEKLIIRTSDGFTLRKDKIGIHDLLDLTHMDTAPLEAVGAPLSGTASADYLDGREGDDRIIGSAGADTLLGGAGNDSLMGGEENGVLDPAAGQVYRLYRATLDRQPDLGGLLAWTDHLAEGTRSLAQVTSGFVNSPEFRTTYANLDATGFVSLLYANVLGRPPDTAGLNAWSNLLNTGARRQEQVVIGFSESAEFKQKTEPDTLMHSREGLKMGLMDDIFRLYQAVLDRSPDQPGFHGWADRLIDGWSFGSVISGFVNSREFQAIYGQTTSQDFVTLLYENVLDRLPDVNGLNAWVSGLQNGTSSRENVVLGFVQSREFITATAAPLRNWVIAQDYDDTLNGGTGTNLLFGGLWADTFEFNTAEPSTNHVVGLESWDRLSFQEFGFETAADIEAHLSESGSTTVFSDQGITIIFEQTTQAEVLAATFLF